MKIIRTIKELKKTISNINNLGFVPTMGGLHKGHLSLINKSVNMCNKTLTSIYINPNQFNNKKDFLKYPQNINKDLKILKKQKTDFVFIPKTYEIYKNQAAIFKNQIIQKFFQPKAFNEDTKEPVCKSVITIVCFDFISNKTVLVYDTVKNDLNK